MNNSTLPPDTPPAAPDRPSQTADRFRTDLASLGPEDIFDYVPDAILVVGPEGQIRSANLQTAQLFGCEREALIGKPIEILLPERFRQQHVAHRRGYLAGPRARPMGAELELYARRCDGSEFPVDIMLSPIEGSGGGITLAVVRDITERKRAEDALHESKAMFQGLFEHSPDAVVVVDADGRIGGLNAQLEYLFGYERGELEGQPVEILLPERYRERHVAHRDRYLSGPRTRPMGAGLELLGRRKDGSEFPVDIMLSPMSLGRKALALGVIRDITERKRAEEALQRSREMFEGLFEHSPDPIVVVDSEGRIVRMNAQLEALFGYRRDELLRQPIEVLLPERFRDQHTGHRRGYHEQPRTRPMGAGVDLYGRRRDGSEFPVDIMLSPMEAEQGRLVLAVIRDITERKEAEQRREVLLREIHHRVKNNLQVVSSMLNLQSESVKDSELLEIITESQNRIRSIALIHEKLHRSTSLGKVNFSDYLQELCSNLFHSYGVTAHAVELCVACEEVALSLDTAVPCGLVVNELVSNCLKHAFPARARGEICVELTSRGGRYRLVVSDNGIGFPHSLDFRGTESLGLQLVNILVRQLDGTIELDCQQGTCFRIDFGEMSYRERA